MSLSFNTLYLIKTLSLCIIFYPKGGGGDKGALTAGTVEIDCGVDIKRPSYLHFSAFLLLIMTVSDMELQKLLYWMWFYQPKRAPKVANLLWYPCRYTFTRNVYFHSY